MIANNAYMFLFVDSFFKADKSFILDAIKRNAAVYGHISNELKRDMDVVDVAIERDWNTDQNNVVISDWCWNDYSMPFDNWRKMFLKALFYDSTAIDGWISQGSSVAVAKNLLADKQVITSFRFLHTTFYFWSYYFSSDRKTNPGNTRVGSEAPKNVEAKMGWVEA